jgi:hypothetical protein
MMKAALLLSDLTDATGSAAFAAPSAHNQPQEPILAHNSLASSMGSAAAVPVVPDANNPNVPGATGRTIVPGDNGTIAGDRSATMNFRTGAYGSNWRRTYSWTRDTLLLPPQNSFLPSVPCGFPQPHHF